MSGAPRLLRSASGAASPESSGPRVTGRVRAELLRCLSLSIGVGASVLTQACPPHSLRSMVPRQDPAVPEPEQLAARARAWAERTCREQGVPVKVSDPRTIQYVAAIFREAGFRPPQA